MPTIERADIMTNELREKRTRSYVTMRSLLDFTMGIIYIAAAVFLLFSKQLGFDYFNFDKTFSLFFGGICALYGGWRIYRGVKKEYY